MFLICFVLDFVFCVCFVRFLWCFVCGFSLLLVLFWCCLILLCFVLVNCLFTWVFVFWFSCWFVVCFELFVWFVVYISCFALG